jgi:hypothetical protein
MTRSHELQTSTPKTLTNKGKQKELKQQTQKRKNEMGIPNALEIITGLGIVLTGSAIQQLGK